MQQTKRKQNSALPIIPFTYHLHVNPPAWVDESDNGGGWWRLHHHQPSFLSHQPPWPIVFLSIVFLPHLLLPVKTEGGQAKGLEVWGEENQFLVGNAVPTRQAQHLDSVCCCCCNWVRRWPAEAKAPIETGEEGHLWSLNSCQWVGAAWQNMVNQTCQQNNVEIRLTWHSGQLGEPMGSIKIWGEGTQHRPLAGIGLCSVEGKRQPVQERILLFVRQFNILVHSRL